MMKVKSGGIEAIKRRYGLLFVLPWIVGVVIFVLVPLISSFIYGLSTTEMTADGMKLTFVGFKNYYRLFVQDPDYVNEMVESLSSLFTSLPIVVALSMVLALVLNQKFHGRMLARAVFFLPVIIGSSVVMTQLAGFSMQSGIMESAGAGAGASAGYMNVINFTDLLNRLELPQSINDLLESYLQDTFNLIWSCGIQILLFVSGLQTIPEQLYEVGKVEGITAWEEFWYITVPMMGRVILLVIFYTMVELFVEKGTLVNDAILTLTADQNYSLSSAMLWPYFALVGIVIGLVVFLYSKICLKRWE